MKICNFDEFVALPPGTIFSYWVSCYAKGLYRKGKTLYRDENDPHDYFQQELHPIPKQSWETQYPGEEGDPVLTDSECRWGMYNFDQLYAVYEREDVDRLVSVIKENCSD